MKATVKSAFIILIALLLTAVIPTDTQAKIYEDTLRLHILAASDKREDQELKLYVRDRLLEKYGGMLNKAESSDDAEELAASLLEEIKNDVALWTVEHGRPQEVSAEIVTEWYDTRDYGEFTLPAGHYRSLRITLNEGCGQNWWCVMYPPLCEGLATERAPSDDGVIDYSRDELFLITDGRYNVKFKLLELFSEAFRKK